MDLTPFIKQIPGTESSTLFVQYSVSLSTNLSYLYQVDTSDSPLVVFLKQVSLNTCKFHWFASFPANKLSYLH